MPYVDRTPIPPSTLTEVEQAKVLKTTGEHHAGFRDHVLFSLALGTGLREFELLALNVGDISPDGERVRRRVTLRVFKRATANPAPQEVFLPDAAWHKLERFLRWKRDQGESLAPGAPVFVSNRKHRLAARTLRHTFALWQRRAGLDRHHRFHSLRHTCCTNAYRATRDIRLVQRIARHKHVDTTAIYAVPSDEDILRAVRQLPS